jgi:uncharacterized protein (DUF2141 family)
VDNWRYISGVPGMIALTMLLVLSCAKISSPSGGPKDTEPPVIVKSEPKNGTVMFTGRSFAVTFNEYVVLDRINEKFMVSPPLETKPDIKLKGKSLNVTWYDTLADSTTYTFYFQDAIRDNNENNPIPNYQYVFSTGPVLDSLSLSGNVFGAFNLEPVEDGMVIMYSNLSDTAPRKLLPAYISRPDLSGGFMINNIRPGHYRLYALKDLNGNGKYDLNDEMFAFSDSIIDITPENNYSIVLDTVKYKPAVSTATTKPDIFTYGQYCLYAFVEDSKKQYLKFTERKSGWAVGFGLALPSDSGQVSAAILDAPAGSWFMENNASRDTFMLWITSKEIYERDVIETLLTHPFTDSTGTITEKTDTVILRYQKPAPARGGQRRTPALKLTTNLAGKMKPGIILSFTGPTPLQDPDTSKIVLLQTVDSVETMIAHEFVRDSTNSRRIFMKAKLNPGASYSLVCKGGAFTDLFGNASDSTYYRFGIATEDEFGSVTARLSGYKGNVIVQLLGEKENVVKEVAVRSPGDVKFELLDKGRYRLKVIYDLDSSGSWTTGDFTLERQPEPVTYYPDELDVKINWALEQDWDIGRPYNKNVSLRDKPTARR